MEKLLSKTKTKGGSYAKHLKNQRTKNICFSCGGYTNIFCRTQANNLIQDALSSPTNNRIYLIT